ncbi:MAG TPA: hypothetical protein PLU30_05555 [Verrucomicrobiae bacterium]|nr:hypothetical protein [Verrucomicrobiae bacterium]
MRQPHLNITLLISLAAAAVSAAGSPAPALKHSDVIFMGTREKSIYEIYGATVVSWGGHARGEDPKAVGEFAARVKDAHDLGMRYCAGAAFRTAFAGMMDFDPNWRDSLCLNIEGKPITVPWLWDHKHKKSGEPAYWFCTSAPGYRKFLKSQIMLGMKADVEGLHIDDYNGTAGTEYHGCCFCQYCMRAFAEFAKSEIPAGRLRACGIASAGGFDYGAFLKSKGISTVEAFKRILGDPAFLGPDYVTFMYHHAAAFVGEARRYGEELAGHPLLLCVNSSASDPKSLIIAPQLTYFCGEVGHGCERPPWGPRANADLGPVWTFKLANAVGRFQACTGSGGDWAHVDASKKPGLVRTWIAQDYAFGHALMAPHRQWAYTKEKGTHWYQSQPEDYAHIYRFIRRNADLFDGYEDVALVGLLYDNAAARKSTRDMREACLWLARNNVPFELALAGDDWLDARLTPVQLAKYRALVVAQPAMLDGEQKRAVEQVAAAKRLVPWDPKTGLDATALEKLIPRQIVFGAAENIVAVPRTVPGRPDAPAVLHLLNRNYDEPSDSMKRLRGVKVELERALFGDRSFSKATLYAPPLALDPKNPGVSQPVSLKLERSATGLTLTIPELDLWGIVKFETQ